MRNEEKSDLRDSEYSALYYVHTCTSLLPFVEDCASGTVRHTSSQRMEYNSTSYASTPIRYHVSIQDICTTSMHIAGHRTVCDTSNISNVYVYM
jgi:hypothetical protein